MKGRIDPDPSEVPTPDGLYDYWTKFPGAEQPRIVRALRSGGPEEVLLDTEALAKGKSYFSLGKHRQSPDHRYYAYLVDQTRSENYLLHVRDLTTGRDLPEVMGDVWISPGARTAEGYGAYTFAFPAAFDSNLLSLVDRGFIYAIAHIRGGLEKGERWHNAGRLRNTFTDFIAVTEHLINRATPRQAGLSPAVIPLVVC
jgi:protease II